MQNSTEGKCSMCNGSFGCGGMCGNHSWGHVLLRIAVAVLIFWCGVQFGELKAMLHNAYAGSRTVDMMYRVSPMQTFTAPVMMSAGAAVQAAAPATKK